MKETNADQPYPLDVSIKGEARLELAGLLGISYNCNYEASRHTQ